MSETKGYTFALYAENITLEELEQIDGLLARLQNVTRSKNRELLTYLGYLEDDDGPSKEHQ